MPEPASTLASLSSALENARRALAILERQAAGFTSLSTPVSLQIELEDKRKEVADLERRLGNAAPAETPVPGIPAPATPDGAAADQHVDPRKLREAMGTAFNKSDFIVLCFDLGVEYENLEGDTLPLRMLSLIKYHQQRGTYSQLVEKVIRERPNLRESLH
ncbi:MAG: hypothetical protein RBT75_12600 [Anaerolineae bacterium]|nr:hypothetical protein [Anaerolineae bacterium]